MWISLCLNLFSIHWASWICSFVYFAKFGRFSAILQIFFLHYILCLLPVSWVCSFFLNLFLSVFQMGWFLLLLCHIFWHFSHCSAFSHWAHPVIFFKFLILYPFIPKFVFLFFFFNSFCLFAENFCLPINFKLSLPHGYSNNALKFLTVKSSIWVISGLATVDCFFPWESVTFSWTLDYWEI